MRLTVVILNWNAARDTCECLSRLESWRSLKPEIYVVDNGSTDNSVGAVERNFPRVHLVINSGNLGFSGGNNVALRMISRPGDADSSQSFVLLLNNDARVGEKDVYLLLEELIRNPRAGVVGPLIFADPACGTLLSAGGLDPATHGKTYWNGSPAEAFVADTSAPYDVDYVSGTVALLRVALLREVGFFDERYFFSCEMADLCERIRNNGYQCLVLPGARAIHDVSASGRPRDTVYRYYSLRNRFLFIRKFRKEQLSRLFCRWMFIGVRGMIGALLAGNPASARALFLALADGVSGRYGGRNDLFSR